MVIIIFGLFFIITFFNRLYESPQKLQTPGRKIQASPDKWLKENLTTPELMRVRGSLSAKLDVIKIENRKGMKRKFN